MAAKLSHNILNWVTITDEEYSECFRFAYDPKLNVELYLSRHPGLTEKKARHDILIGKIGEIGVYKIFEKIATKIHYPDFTVYDITKKSWKDDVDFLYDGVRVSLQVKTCTPGRSFPISWIVEKIDGKIFKDPDQSVVDIILFVEVECVKRRDLTVQYRARIDCAMSKAVFVAHPEILGYPKSEKAREKKHAIYFIDKKDLFDKNLPEKRLTKMTLHELKSSLGMYKKNKKSISYEEEKTEEEKIKELKIKLQNCFFVRK